MLSILAFRNRRAKLRVQLAMRLNELIADRHLTQARAAELFGIPQPHVSELKHYKLNRFSSERLLRFVTLLDRDVRSSSAKARGTRRESYLCRLPEGGRPGDRGLAAECRHVILAKYP